MSSPYSQSHLNSSSPHSQVDRSTTAATMMSSDPPSIPPCFTAPTPVPSFVIQPSSSRSPLPSSSAPLVKSSRLPLRKRPAKEQQKPMIPTQLQWQPIETAKINTITTEPYPHKSEFLTPSFDSSFTEPLESHSALASQRQDQQQHNDKYHIDSILNSPSPREQPSTQPLFPSSIPTKPMIQKQQQQQQSAKKKHTNTDENDRPIKKTKRGRPPLSSSIKPLSSQTTSNKTSATTQNNNGTSTSSKTPKSVAAPPDAKHTPTLYCLCRKPYDESQFMIGCDRCEEWFHGECIGIDEKQGEFVDYYYCADCVKESGKQTSWKPKCSNSSCQKAARTGKNQHGHLSKYCSGACGMQVARERLTSSDRKYVQQNKGDGCDDDAEKADVTTFNTRMEQLSNSRLSLFADRDDRLRLTRIRGEKRRAIDAINSINLKQQFLQALIKTVEQEQQINDYCGFDSRLLWDDEQWDGVTSVETEPTLRLLKSDTTNTVDQQVDGTVCQKSKRCQRHNGWVKLKTVELEQERDEQFVVLSILARERKLIKARMNNRLDEMNVARSLMNGTLLHYQ